MTLTVIFYGQPAKQPTKLLLPFPIKSLDYHVNAEKAKCVTMCHEKTAEQNHNIKIGNRFLNIVTNSGYLGIILINENHNLRSSGMLRSVVRY
jgi:hypothetical protein